jgi:hypothetical protein
MNLVRCWTAVIEPGNATRYDVIVVELPGESLVDIGYGHEPGYLITLTNFRLDTGIIHAHDLTPDNLAFMFNDHLTLADTEALVPELRQLLGLTALGQMKEALDDDLRRG